jgi:NAD(P)-dependent dehydrogenase (short-subunit alcohol dehydrogenase family)
MPTQQPFAGRTIVLIGGGSGIGLATARLVTAGQGTVILGGRTPERLATAAATLGPQAGWHQVDTADQDSIDAFFDHVGTRFGTVHGLFTTAADYVTGPMAQLSVDEAATAFDSKFWGQYRSVKAAIPLLSSDAAIVLMSGAAGARPAVVAPAYSAANAAVEGLARGLAVELAPVTVDGDLWGRRDPDIREQAFAAYRDASTIGRLADEDDIAQSVAYLLSSRVTTGSTLFPDGGYAFR